MIKDQKQDSVNWKAGAQDMLLSKHPDNWVAAFFGPTKFLVLTTKPERDAFLLK